MKFLQFLTIGLVGMLMNQEARANSSPKGSLYGWEALTSVFDKLDRLQKAPGSDSVLIIQIGDSHSAADNISGSWRERLQLRYGNAGRGVMAPGVIYKGYAPRQMTVTQSSGWEVRTYLNNLTATHSIPFFGLSGHQLSTNQAGASLRLSANDSSGFDKVSVCALIQPDGGTFELFSDGVSAVFSLKSASTGIGCFGSDFPEPKAYVDLVAKSGPVVLTSVSTRRSAGGVALANFGVIGAQVPHFGFTDDAAIKAELNYYRPDLLVFAFGTNDGFGSKFNKDRFEKNLRTQISRLQKLAPGVPILLIGSPDAARRESGFARWKVPDGLAQVRDIQKTVALDMGLSFWNLSERLGGANYVKEWVEATPPKMSSDRVHYTKAGAAEIARMLHEDFMSASGN